MVERIPAPEADTDKPLKALIFDSYYDNYKGAMCFVRVVEGSVRVGSKIRMFVTGKEFDVTEVGVFCPKLVPCAELKAGEVGYIAASIKTVKDAHVGDTITDAASPADAAAARL